jgi:hypothetical protein
MKPSAIICFSIFVIGVLIWLLQLWVGIWSADVFHKLISTIGAVFLVAFAAAFLIRENQSDKKMNKLD